MDSAELSRKVAEAMGLQECCDFLGWGHVGKCSPKRVDERCSVQATTNWPFDLADARDREAVIAWLNDQGFSVITWSRPGHSVVVIRGDESEQGFGADGAPTIEEAFGRAFLAATEEMA